jgi:hypothetical protein
MTILSRPVADRGGVSPIGAGNQIALGEYLRWQTGMRDPWDRARAVAVRAKQGGRPYRREEP